MNTCKHLDLRKEVENAIIGYIVADPFPSDTIRFKRDDIYKCMRTLLEEKFDIHTQAGFIDVLDALIAAGEIESCSEDGMSPYYQLVEDERLFLRLKVERYKRVLSKIGQILRKAEKIIERKH